MAPEHGRGIEIDLRLGPRGQVADVEAELAELLEQDAQGRRVHGVQLGPGRREAVHAALKMPALVDLADRHHGDEPARCQRRARFVRSDRRVLLPGSRHQADDVHAGLLGGDVAADLADHDVLVLETDDGLESLVLGEQAGNELVAADLGQVADQGSGGGRHGVIREQVAGNAEPKNDKGFRARPVWFFVVSSRAWAGRSKTRRHRCAPADAAHRIAVTSSTRQSGPSTEHVARVQDSEVPVTRRVTVVGAGFAALSSIRKLRQLDPSLDLTLVAPRAEFVFYPGTIWIPSRLRRAEDLVVPLDGFLRRHRVDFRAHAATGLSADGRTLHTDGGDIANDALVIASGGRFLKALPE